MSTLLPLVLLPDPLLRKKATSVSQIDESTILFLEQMHQTMEHASGIGLAAPQVGVLRRLVVIDLQEKTEQNDELPKFLINPIILSTSDEWDEDSEGCLSIPQQTGLVHRPSAVQFRYTDIEGKEHEHEVDGLYARCLQHEIDHLEGKLFIDHLSRLRKSLMTKRAGQIKKELAQERETS